MESPPPLPQTPKVWKGASGPIKILIILGGIVALAFAFLVLCRAMGLLIPYQVPTGAMRPAIVPGDRVIMEGFSLRYGSPGRGDIIVFKTDGIRGINHGSVFVMRVVGLPGEQLQFRGGGLFVDAERKAIRNEKGEIIYEQGGDLPKEHEISVSEGGWFVAGDNSKNSFDSRFWGSVPRENIKGKIWFRYWPINRMGAVE